MLKKLLSFLLICSLVFPCLASPSQLLYQGDISVDGASFTGNLQMKFVLHNGASTLWTNDGTGDLSTEPGSSVQVSVEDGLYSVAMGDTNLTNMQSLNNSVYGQSDLLLRVWVDSGSGFQLMNPDKAFYAVPFAQSVVDGHVENSSANLSSLKVGTLTYLGTNGSTGQVLLSQGDGTLVWGNVSAADLSTITNIDIDGGNIDGAPIGTISASSGNFTNLMVIDASGTVIHTSGNRIGIGTEATSYRLTLPNEAGASGMGIAYTWVTYSSARYKENIREIDGALETVQKLRGVHYDSKPEYGGQNQIGFIAEEVGQVLPEIVQFEEDRQLATGMDYSRLPALTVQAIKELAERQKRENEQLKAENEALKARLDRLENLLLNQTK